MTKRTKKIITSLLKWTIAIGGMVWVISQYSLWDSVLALDPVTTLPRQATLAQHADEDDAEFHLIDPASKKVVTVPRDQVVNPASGDDKPKPIKIVVDGQPRDAMLYGMRLSGDINGNPTVEKLLIKLPDSDRGQWIDPPGEFRLDVPRPRVEVGIVSMVHHANPWLLVAAMAVFPATFLITSFRWHKLLQAVDVNMGFKRAFELTMVGAFFNTFMPGSVGGDVFKMYYASKQTPHRTRAVVSVFIDRVLGLLALVMLGGVMAAYQYAVAPSKDDPTARACLRVAIISVGILAAAGMGMAVLFQPTIRKWLGVEFILSRLPMQHQIEHAREVTRIYRRQPVFMLVMLIITFPVHITTVVSTMLACKAFGLPLQTLYYFTVVPVVVLVGAIPISPQGAGVMEVFAVMLTQQQGATVSQAFALTMSIRMVQILWNLTGGIFVIRGGYHAPTDSEKREFEEDTP